MHSATILNLLGMCSYVLSYKCVDVLFRLCLFLHSAPSKSQEDEFEMVL